MRKPQHTESITALLKENRILEVNDFMAACPGMPAASVYSKIRSLVASGQLSGVGRGRYLAIRKPEYIVYVTEWMKEVNNLIFQNCVGVSHCITTQGDNLFVEVGRQDIELVENCLRSKYPRVIRKQDADRFPAELKGFIIVGPLISDAPLIYVDGCPVSSLEKSLVDSLTKNKDNHYFQRALEINPVNMNRLRRYSARRGLAEELQNMLSSLNKERIAMFADIQRYFGKVAVDRVWLFGSFSRFEETPDSDIDLLVDYCPEADLSLLDIIRIRLDLEKITGRSVDLVQVGTLRPFATPSSEEDKYLIYER